MYKYRKNTDLNVLCPQSLAVEDLTLVHLIKSPVAFFTLPSMSNPHVPLITVSLFASLDTFVPRKSRMQKIVSKADVSASLWRIIKTIMRRA